MKNLIPLGSIVLLNGGTKKIMIIVRGAQAEINGGEHLFDYAGCLYPIGFATNELIYFNAENVAEVIFDGFTDKEEQEYQQLHAIIMKSERVKNMPRGQLAD